MLAAPSPERGDWSGVVARQQELTAESLWTEVSDRLKGALNETTFGTWFGDVSSRELNDERVRALGARTTSRATGSKGISST